MDASITVDVALYGPLARHLGGRHVAQRDVQLEPGARVGDLLEYLGIAAEEKGFVFLNAVLCDVPGLDVSRGEPLHDGDHIGIFSKRHMWPYQYRDGVKMSAALTEAMREHGAMHHSYRLRGKEP